MPTAIHHSGARTGVIVGAWAVFAGRPTVTIASPLAVGLALAISLAPRPAHSEPPAHVEPPTAASAAALPQGDASHGKILYQGCSACHSIDQNDIGPRHRGVVGRAAASLPDYAYSAALKKSGLTWDEITLDRWLINPSALVPGTKMFFKIDDARSRADLIAYLKEQK